MGRPTETEQRLRAVDEAKTAGQEAGRSGLRGRPDPSQPRRRPGAAGGRAAGRRGVEWARLSDVVTGRAMGAGSVIAGGQAAAVRKVRALANPVSRRGTARRSAAGAGLPPVSAFGVRPPRTGRAGPGKAVGT
ncbi:MAG: hypothetical protein LBO20_00820 [Bifidobacteriaceae bacterium]|jgi:hypothetical protein|nr:hypothetical protein [Bifidobacteriaceae bacterium]